MKRSVACLSVTMIAIAGVSFGCGGEPSTPTAATVSAGADQAGVVGQRALGKRDARPRVHSRGRPIDCERDSLWSGSVGHWVGVLPGQASKNRRPGQRQWARILLP